MRVSRFYIDAPLSKGQHLTLPPQLVNYIANVLRLKTGDNIVLFNGQAVKETPEQPGEFTAILTDVTKRHVSVQVESFVSRNTESPIQIHLFQGISRSERMDFTIQKSVELGISSITPIFTQRSNSGKLNDKRLTKKMQHWQGVAVSACEQSGRTSLVEIHEPIQVNQIDTNGADINLLLLPTAHTSLTTLTKKTPVKVNIFIGPEGGLSDNEIEWANKHGFEALKLGDRILRTETAGLTILSILQFLWGDLS